METVDVLVRIPKKDFEELQSNYVWWGKHGEYIKKGTVLPKGHGRLIDVDAATKDINAFQDAFAMYTDNMGKYNIVCAAPTIIEADKEVQDGNS